jgi:hypothetical protein
MAPLKDLDVLAKFRHALREWNCTGYITWKSVAREWVEENLDGVTTRAIGEEMFRHFSVGGDIDKIEESRAEWSDCRYHYDFRVAIEGRLLYIETLLIDDERDDPTIHVVSIHDV